MSANERKSNSGRSPGQFEPKPDAASGPSISSGGRELAVESYITVPPVLLLGDEPVSFDVYRRSAGGSSDLSLLKPAGERFSPADLASLNGSQQDGLSEPLYVAADRYDEYHRRAEGRLAAVLTDESLGTQRFSLAVQLAVQLVEELLDRPNDDLMARAIALVGRLVEHSQSRPADVAGLLDCRSSDYDTPYHMVNVALLSLLVGQASQMSADDQRLFTTAALLHDIGKIGLPEGLLSKEGRLTEGEWMLYREHVDRGVLWLRNLHADPMVTELAWQHHETIDGRGFPRGLAETKIHPLARLLAVLDVYDGLVTGRPFREPLSPQMARSILKMESNRLDGDAVELLANLIEDGRLNCSATCEQAGAEAAVQDADAPLPPLDSFLPLPPLSMRSAKSSQSAGGSGADRRNFARHAFNASCRMQFVRPGASAEAHISFWVHTLDISRGGIQFIHSQPLRIGEVVSVFLPAPRGRQVKAMIVRCRRGSHGLYFVAARFDF